MDKTYERLYHTVEEDNWWFVARRDMLMRLLERHRVPLDAQILDIGCAGGALLLALKERGYTALTALDYSPDAIARCKAGGLERAFVMDGHRPEFPERTFDVIIASDCLEHLSDDQTALANWNRVLKTSGIALIFVPAYQFLWSAHDEANHHYRRYTRRELAKKASAAGFQILESGYWNLLFLFPTAMLRLGARVLRPVRKGAAKAQVLQLPRVLNHALIALLRRENAVASRFGFPIGMSAFVIAKK